MRFPAKQALRQNPCCSTFKSSQWEALQERPALKRAQALKSMLPSYDQLGGCYPQQGYYHLQPVMLLGELQP